MSLGPYGRLPFGADPILQSLAGQGGLSGTSAPLTALNNGVAFRFTAPDTRDVKAVNLYWNSIPSAPTTAPQVQVRIEAIDATTGKPATGGALYDANAHYDGITISATGWANYQFATTPTTHLTAGSEYAVVVLNTTGTAGGSGTLTLGYLAGYACLPAAVLAATDGTTRSNFGEITTALPACTLTLTDGTTDTEETLEFCPYSAVDSTNYTVYGTRSCGVEFVVPTGETWGIRGFEVNYLARVGAPGSDLRVQILDATNTPVSGAASTVSRNSLLNASGRRLRRSWGSVISLAAGTYRLAFDFSDHTQTSSSNYFGFRPVVLRSGTSLPMPTNYLPTYTTDITATPVTWTNEGTTKAAPVALLFDSIAASGGGGSAVRVGRPMTGGYSS